MKKTAIFKIVVTVCFVAIAIAVFVALGARFQSNTKTFNFADITKIEITDGSNGNFAIITDQEQIQILIRPYNENEFRRGRSATNNTGRSYRISFYQDNMMGTGIDVNSNKRIAFEGYFYDTKDGAIDIDYYKVLINEQLELQRAAN